jgi:hypothetical protein
MTEVATSSRGRSTASEQYFMLADISGYTAFLRRVERVHGVDFGLGVPAGYEILAALLDVVVRALQPTFSVVKIEGDAVFAVAPASALDGEGSGVLGILRAATLAFREVQREQAATATDHLCTACPVAGTLWIKVLLHRGVGVQVEGRSHAELHGPAVNVVHRMLKNTVVTRTGPYPYLFLTDVAATYLQLATEGIEHREAYPDAGEVRGRIIPLE